MITIKHLDALTVNQIAAGEVVEKPASVVKELVENALDANASVISVSIRNGGIALIQVIDNGIGMSGEDLKLAFQSHTTSKISSIDDFNRIKTMGFRGEALASIAAVSRIRVKSKPLAENTGYGISMEAGKIFEEGVFHTQDGTNITVESLFFNTPARYKFLKKDSTEASYVADMMERFILARPDVAFIFINNDQEVLHSPGNNDLKSAIYTVYGKDIINALIPIHYKHSEFSISGFVGKPEISRKNRQHQSIFVNQRYVKSPVVMAAIEEAYKTLLMKGKYPFYAVHIQINPALVDVNVHPQKTQIKFWDENELFRGVYHGVSQVLEETQDQSSIEEASKTTFHQDIQENEIYLVTRTETDPDRQLSINTNPLGNENLYRVMESPELYENRKYIGSAFNTYLIFESDDTILLIDQHAAHERIIFEKLYQQRVTEKTPITSQSLLVPEVIEMTSTERMVLSENQDIIQSLGFEFESYGNQSILLRSIPLTRDLLDPIASFRAVVDSVSDQSMTLQNKISESLYTIACKAAVKAHDKLDRKEIDSLMRDIEKTARISHCPHGRPTMIKLSRKEIEKWFKRIVS